MEKIKCEFCGKEYSKKGIGTHVWRNHGDGKNFDPNIKIKSGEKQIWNKGLTYDTDKRIEKITNKLKGQIRSTRGKKMSDEARKKMSISAKTSPKHNTWKSRNIKSYPEIFFEGVLLGNNILDKCEREFLIKGDSCTYFLDFFFPEKNLDLEIDGSQHEFRKEQDLKRDEFLNSKGIKVYRIRWKGICNDELKQYIFEEIRKFLEFYSQM